MTAVSERSLSGILPRRGQTSNIHECAACSLIQVTLQQVPPDLLDILSSNQSLLVAKHLKLFDSIAKLTMMEKEGVLTNVAVKMTAKDGVEVSFCDGQLEKWLNRLMQTMRKI